MIFIYLKTLTRGATAVRASRLGGPLCKARALIESDLEPDFNDTVTDQKFHSPFGIIPIESPGGLQSVSPRRIDFRLVDCVSGRDQWVKGMHSR